MSPWTKLAMQDSSSPIMEQLMFFHDHTMAIVIAITTMVIYMMMKLLKNKMINTKMNEHQMIETTWTIMPAMILVMIAIPSLKILYMMEEMINPTVSIKTMGHQWYWTYEYSDKKKNEMESYMKKNTKKQEIRLMEVDNRMKMPLLTQIRMIVSSSDVIHSWTIQSMGIKMDAIPGRLNQLNLMSKKPGLFFGQCSEICGTNHSYMPITVESIKMKLFKKWIKN
uniref:Cytochrome c oxidase subunit 2 n=1 Tax=Ugyops sp. APL-2018 TaxID=2250388 RepID=A0A3G1RJ95_9HEMI|nr:cytochrome c oxidase subunit II [Ugyops sp. APL-2018]